MTGIGASFPETAQTILIAYPAPPLRPKQRLLQRQAAAVAAQGTVSGEDSMAGYDQG